MGQSQSLFERIGMRVPYVREHFKYHQELKELEYITNLSTSKDTHSVHGEDIILSACVKQKEGFYVDIGAHHPSRKSNTKIFYDRGWSGINVEANPAAIPAFERDRPRDINLNCAVTNYDGEITFYLMG